MIHFVGSEELCGYGIEEHIKFNSTAEAPAPDPKILALHAACAGIAHMSGAAEYLQELFRDTDSIAVMTEPNAADELRRVLKARQLVSAMA